MASRHANSAASWRRSPGSGPWEPARWSHRLPMRPASTTAGSCLPGWDWCPGRPPAEASRSCWASASAATCTCEPCDPLEHARRSCAAQRKRGQHQRLARQPAQSPSSEHCGRRAGQQERAHVVWALLAHGREFRADYAPRPRPHSRVGGSTRRIRHRRSHHRLLRRSHAVMARQVSTGVGEAQNDRSTSSATKRLQEPTSKILIRDSGSCRNEQSGSYGCNLPFQPS